MQEETDARYMRMALEEARAALQDDEIPIGAVIVADGRVIGRGHNMTETLGDVTAHAEMLAITAATQTLGGKYLTGATIYVTVEPCLMCAGAIAWSQLSRIVYGADDPKRGYSTYITARNTTTKPAKPSATEKSKQPNPTPNIQKFIPNAQNSMAGIQNTIEDTQNSTKGIQHSTESIQNSIGGIQNSKSKIQNSSPSPFHPKATITTGILAEECATLMRDFFRSKR
ncbi:MAG: hypothetical protein BHV67_05530 [Bacteroidales bacterium 43_36]|nr:MAG: hypothetical protein BHV67_05530 [Bacteroidales bacterium 43_36]